MGFKNASGKGEVVGVNIVVQNLLSKEQFSSPNHALNLLYQVSTHKPLSHVAYMPFLSDGCLTVVIQ